MGMTGRRTRGPIRAPSAPANTSSSAEIEDRIRMSAQRLAVRFTREVDLPPRLARASRTSQVREPASDSEAERRLATNVQAWERVIQTMVNKIPDPTVWRLIALMPEVKRDVSSISECQDFLELVDYLVLRRDNEGCDDDELGLLATLVTGFQREVEAALANRKAK